jgi:hypothetical protein
LIVTGSVEPKPCAGTVPSVRGGVDPGVALAAGLDVPGVALAGVSAGGVTPERSPLSSLSQATRNTSTIVTRNEATNLIALA